VRDGRRSSHRSGDQVSQYVGLIGHFDFP
jgi:hypothetical protein